MSDQPATAATAALRDLLLRCDHAAKQLDLVADEHRGMPIYPAHLVSKAQGVRLVIGYIEEALRDIAGITSEPARSVRRD